MLRNVVFHDRRFSVEGIDITDRTAFDKAFQLVSQIYNQTIPRLLVDTHSDVIATNIFLPAQDSLLRVRMMIV